MRVAAADDDEQVRDVMARLLSRLGAEVALARCGEEAFELIRGAMSDAGRRFDLAFIDLSMPWPRRGGGSADGPPSGGLELAAAVRAEEARSGSRPLRLVALTGADGGRALDARRSGFDAFLQKPAGMDALRQELELAAAPRPKG
jgi:CheY-like chemotaxis protein